MNRLSEVSAQMLHDLQCVLVATFPLEHRFAVLDEPPERQDTVSPLT